MDNREFSPGVISNRRTAIAVHRRLCDANAPMLKLGRFYCSALDRGIWGSQKAMAKELGVSTVKVCRTVAAARLPNEVLALFSARTLTFRNASTLDVLVEQFGEAEVIKRASAIPVGTPVADILAILSTGQKAPRRAVRVSIVAGSAKYIRIDVPNIALVAPRLKELEDVINAVLGSNVR
ncbi:hypothetical protein [Paraburkholderia atlantica]|uniref:hypothetical protein n=1 Tax=Paraburkholderia atlantica TaxID=2654982 RepID=UPI00160E4A93|nr:hypothetical protein [Paraburkholderia atlantica]MBB5510645.1 hypothetical protein [Paraburkholderia atlantica]